MLTSLPVGGPDVVPVTDPPGALFISGASGIEITVKAAEGTVIGVPYYWQDSVWQPLLGDATVAPRQVKAVAAGVNIGHLYFNKPATPLWFAILETGGGTVSFCDIREADGATTLGQQDVSGSGGGGGPAATADQGNGNSSAAQGWSVRLTDGTAFYDAPIKAQLPAALVGGRLDVNIGASSATVPVSGPLTDAQLRATAVPVSGPLTDAQLRATPVPVSGTVTANIGTSGSLATEATLAGVATSVKQSDGTQRTKITDGTNNAAVLNSAPTGSEYGLLVRQVGTVSLPTITTATLSSTAVSDLASSTVLAANASAKGRTFYNVGAGGMWIRYGSGAHTGSATATFLLPAGQTITMLLRSDGSVEWPGVVQAISNVAGGGTLNVTELT